MPWVKLDDQFPDHPKVLAAGSAAAWLYVCGLCYCNHMLTDGFIPASKVPLLAVSGSRLAKRLVAAQLWTEASRGGERGYAVHDYHAYQPTKEEVDAATDAKRRAGRAGGLAAARARATATAQADATAGGIAGGIAGAQAESKPVARSPVPEALPDENSTRSEGHAPAVRARVETPAKPALITACRGATLMPPAPKNTLWPGRPPVADFVHADLRQRLGPQQAEQDLFAFYERTAEAWRDQAIAEDAPKFWRARFAEWQGGSAGPATGRRALSAQNDATLRTVLSRGKAER